MRRTLMPRLHRFARDTRGGVSVEFVLVMPFLFWAYMATYIYFDGFRQSAQNLKAAYAIGDMISRETEAINDNYIDSMVNVLQLMTRSQSQIKLMVTVVRWDETDQKYYVDWSANRGFAAAHSNGDMMDLADKLPVMPDNERVILIETESSYVPIFDIGMGEQNLDNFVFTRPRFVNNICWESC